MCVYVYVQGRIYLYICGVCLMQMFPQLDIFYCHCIHYIIGMKMGVELFGIIIVLMNEAWT